MVFVVFNSLAKVKLNHDFQRARTEPRKLTQFATLAEQSFTPEKA